MDFTHQKVILAKKPSEKFAKHKISGRPYGFLVILSIVVDDKFKSYYQVFKSIKSKNPMLAESTAKKVFLDLERAEAEIIEFTSGFKYKELLELNIEENQENEVEQLSKFVEYAV